MMCVRGTVILLTTGEFGGQGEREKEKESDRNREGGTMMFMCPFENVYPCVFA